MQTLLKGNTESRPEIEIFLQSNVWSLNIAFGQKTKSRPLPWPQGKDQVKDVTIHSFSITSEGIRGCLSVESKDY